MPPLLVTGAGGHLGGYLLRQGQSDGLPLAAWSHAQGGARFGYPVRPVDLTDFAATSAAFADARPAVVLHAAALARVGDCFRDPVRARRVNADATAHLAALCAARGARLVLVSTDLVFDGERPPYREGALPAPASAYGRSKADAEAAVLEGPANLVVRVSLLFGPSLGGGPGFFDAQVEALRAGRPLVLFDDEWRTPLDLPGAARGLLAAAASAETGILHLGGPERLSRWEMGRHLAGVLGADPALAVATGRDRVTAAEPRPRDVSLDSSRFRARFPDPSCPPHVEALRRMLAGTA